MTTPVTAPVPNTGPMKFVSTGIGIAAGVAASIALDRAFVGPEKASELRDAGEPTLDSRQLQVYGFGVPFGLAAGIGLGLQKRSPTAGFTTGQQVLVAALLSTAAGAVIDAQTDRAGDKVVGTAAMAAAVGGGALIGLRDEVPLAWARHGGLVAFGLAIGAALPLAMEAGRALPEAFTNGVRHRER